MSTIKTPETYLDEVAKEVSYNSFKDMIACRILEGSKATERTQNLITNSVKEAMKRYANDIEIKLLES